MYGVDLHPCSEQLPLIDTQNFDLLNPDMKDEATKHKLKRLVQSPNSFFMDVKCPGCFQMYALTLAFWEGVYVWGVGVLGFVLLHGVGRAAREVVVETL